MISNLINLTIALNNSKEIPESLKAEEIQYVT